MVDKIYFLEPTEKEREEHIETVSAECLVRGLTPLGYCTENGHKYLPTSDWPPRMRCFICGDETERPPPEPFKRPS